MRLKLLTNFNTFLLVAVCVALGATLWWSQKATHTATKRRVLRLVSNFRRIGVYQRQNGKRLNLLRLCYGVMTESVSSDKKVALCRDVRAA